jgi:linoleoyl-CoA desaturase
MPQVSFNNKPNPFFQSLKQKVDAYFTEIKKKPSGNGHLFIKSTVLICSLAGLYVVLVFFTPHPVISIVLCSLLGLCMALIGFNIMHEGAHQSISKYKWLNKVSAYTLNMMGGTSHFWKLKHNICHHTYTNISGEDHDLDLRPLMRLDVNQKRYWFHRYQQYYWILLYSISYIAWVFYQDFHKYFSGRMAPGASEKHRFPLRMHFIFWITKLAYVGVFILVPLLFVGAAHTATGFLVATVVCGIVISIVFQMAHVVETTAFPLPQGDSTRIENEWALHQLSTTADFSTDNKTISWMLGGLNFQVEHHLFPKVSHVYYPQLRKMVKETCAEFNVTYNEFPSLYGAFRSHLLYLKRLGRE